MKVSKVILFGNVPAGTLVWLDKKQAAARAHAISEVETKERMKDRKLYAANAQLGFKAGEELAVEGDLDRGLEAMFGITPATAGNKVAEKIAAAEKKVESIKAQIDTETASVAAATEDADRSKAQGKLDKAKAALVRAEGELAKLQS